MSIGHQRSYRRSSFIVLTKQCLEASQRILPALWYERLESMLLDIYRQFSRCTCIRHWMVYKIRGDQLGAERVMAIFRVMPYSLVGTGGLKATYDAVTHIEKTGMIGALVECGVAQGGSAVLIAETSARFGTDRPVWLYDSYEGLPVPTEKDFVGGTTGRHVRPLPRGSCLGTYEQVEGLLFEKFGLERRKIHIVKGWFENTLPATRNDIGTIALLRVDADWYESVKCCLDNLYDQVTPGGYIIIDDYESCFGAQKAVDEFLSRRRLQVQMTFDGRGGCVFIKPM